MAQIWFFDGFDVPYFKPGAGVLSGPSNNLNPKWTKRISTSIDSNTAFWDNVVQQGRRTGSKALAQPFCLQKTLLPTNTPGLAGYIFGFALKRSHSIASGPILSHWDTNFGSGNPKWAIMMRADGKLDVVKGGTWSDTSGLSGYTVLGTTTTALQLNNWAYIEVSVTTAQLRLYINGNLQVTAGFTPEISLSGVLVLFHTYIHRDAGNNPIAVYPVDDFYALYFSSSENPDQVRLGDVAVWTKQPSSAPIVEWSATTAGPVNSVNEGYFANPTQDNEYVWSGENGKRIVWRADFPETEIQNVVAVQVTGYGKTEGGFNPAYLKAQFVYGTAITELAPELNSDATSKEYGIRALITQKPGGGNFQPTDLDSLGTGVVIRA